MQVWPSSTLLRRNLKTAFSLWKRTKCVPSTPHRRNLKTSNHWEQEITWFAWRHRFRKAPFSKRFPSTPQRKARDFKFLLKSIFDKLRFRDGLEWTEGLTVVRGVVRTGPERRRAKHDVYGRRQTAKITSDFLFFSCNPLLHHTK